MLSILKSGFFDLFSDVSVSGRQLVAPGLIQILKLLEFHFVLLAVHFLFLFDLLLLVLLLLPLGRETGGSPVDAALLNLHEPVQFLLLSGHLSEDVVVEVGD